MRQTGAKAAAMRANWLCTSLPNCAVARLLHCAFPGISPEAAPRPSPHLAREEVREALDGHVVERQKVVEGNAVSAAQLTLVGRFKLGLAGRQECAAYGARGREYSVCRQKTGRWVLRSRDPSCRCQATAITCIRYLGHL